MNPVPLGGAGDPRRLGDRAAGTRERGVACRHARVRRPVGDVPAHAARGVRARCRPARGPDGQLRGRSPQPRRRHGREAGPRPHRRGDRGRQLLREPRAARCVCRRARLRREPAPGRPRVGGRRALEPRPPACVHRARRTRAGAARSCCTHSPTAGTRSRRRPRSTSRRRRLAGRGRRCRGARACRAR